MNRTGLLKKLSFLFCIISCVAFISGCSDSSGGSSGSSDSSESSSTTSSSDDDDDLSDYTGVTCTTDWTEASHSNDADPDYAEVFDYGETDEVHTIKLTIDEDDWSDMLSDMEDLYGTFGTGTSSPEFSDENPVWKPCTFEYNDKTWCYVGVRFKGNSSLSTSWKSGKYKLPFRFNFDKFEDDYEEIKNQRFYGFKKLTLSSNYDDESFLREKIVADLFREAGVPAPRTAFYKLYVDFGEGSTYFGLYTMVEIPDDPMLDDQFGNSDGNIYKPDGDAASFSYGTYDEDEFEKKNNDDEDEIDYSDVLAVYTALKNSDFYDLETVFNVDGFMNWLAVNTVVQNWDTYGVMTHNYYLYNDEDTNKLNWIPWDNNESLGDSKNWALSLNLSEVSSTSWPLIGKLIDESSYWDAYTGYVEDFVTNIFVVDDMEDRFQEAHDLIKTAVYEEDTGSAYSLLNSFSDFNDSVDDLTDHVDDRCEAVDHNSNFDYTQP